MRKIPEVSDAQLAFGCNLPNVPSMKEIPEEFKHHSGTTEEARKWIKCQSDWMFVGLSVSGLIAKEGVDKEKALRYLNCPQTSREQKHEVKQATVAYLLSEWFDGYLKNRGA